MSLDFLCRIFPCSLQYPAIFQYSQPAYPRVMGRPGDFQNFCVIHKHHRQRIPAYLSEQEHEKPLSIPFQVHLGNTHNHRYDLIGSDSHYGA